MRPDSHPFCRRRARQVVSALLGLTFVVLLIELVSPGLLETLRAAVAPRGLLFWTLGGGGGIFVLVNFHIVYAYFHPEADVGGPHLGAQVDVVCFVLHHADLYDDVCYVRTLMAGQTYWGLSDLLVARWIQRSRLPEDLVAWANVLQQLLEYAAMAPLSFALIEQNIEYLLKLSGRHGVTTSGLLRTHPVIVSRRRVLALDKAT